MMSSALRMGHHSSHLCPSRSSRQTMRKSQISRTLVRAKVVNVTRKLKAPSKSPARKGTQRMQPKKTFTQKAKKPSLGTIAKRKLQQGTEIAQAKGASFKTRSPGTSAPLLLARVQQLRLLSKLEQAGLLSLLEKNGVTLTFIEKSGLLSKAESLGLLSAAANRNTPTLLYRIAAAVYIAGPLLLYIVPDSSTPVVAVQAVIAIACLTGGTAAFGAATLLGTLQKDLVA
ncbi:hypothetical protein ABBQ32_007449 [Trebouxia sp. C0010 RCD-2024]